MIKNPIRVFVSLLSVAGLVCFVGNGCVGGTPTPTPTPTPTAAKSCKDATIENCLITGETLNETDSTITCAFYEAGNVAYDVDHSYVPEGGFVYRLESAGSDDECVERKVEGVEEPVKPNSISSCDDLLGRCQSFGPGAIELVEGPVRNAGLKCKSSTRYVVERCLPEGKEDSQPTKCIDTKAGGGFCVQSTEPCEEPTSDADIAAGKCVKPGPNPNPAPPTSVDVGTCQDVNGTDAMKSATTSDAKRAICLAAKISGASGMCRVSSATLNSAVACVDQGKEGDFQAAVAALNATGTPAKCASFSSSACLHAGAASVTTVTQFIPGTGAAPNTYCRANGAPAVPCVDVRNKSQKTCRAAGAPAAKTAATELCNQFAFSGAASGTITLAGGCATVKGGNAVLCKPSSGLGVVGSCNPADDPTAAVDALCEALAASSTELVFDPQGGGQIVTGVLPVGGETAACDSKAISLTLDASLVKNNKKVTKTTKTTGGCKAQ